MQVNPTWIFFTAEQIGSCLPEIVFYSGSLSSRAEQWEGRLPDEFLRDQLRLFFQMQPMVFLSSYWLCFTPGSLVQAGLQVFRRFCFHLTCITSSQGWLFIDPQSMILCPKIAYCDKLPQISHSWSSGFCSQSFLSPTLSNTLM